MKEELKPDAEKMTFAEKLKYRFRQIKKFPKWIYWLPARMMMLSCFLKRREVIDPNHYFEKYTNNDDKQAVVVIWHNRLLYFAPMCNRKVRQRTVAVISVSRDGQYIADLVEQFGVKSVRGSSSRNAVKVLHDAFKSLKGGNLIAMTPDGPRGPKYHLNKGAIQLASKMGIPVIPIAVNYSSYWQLHSWDAFQIPKPWSKISIVVGDEIPVGENLTPEEFEEARLRVENALMAVTEDILPPPPPRAGKKKAKK